MKFEMIPDLLMDIAGAFWMIVGFIVFVLSPIWVPVGLFFWIRSMV